MTSETLQVSTENNTVIVEQTGAIVEVVSGSSTIIEVVAAAIDVEVVEQVSQVIEVVEQGPKGDKGDKGDAGDATSLTNPFFTYNGDELSRVDYDNNAFKALQYDSGGALEFLQFDNDGIIQNRQFIYNPDGTLSNIIDT